MKKFFSIFISNILYMVLVAANNFILPKFTSVETYAAIKEYTLYINTYATFVTFGYIQGMYLKYGGYDLRNVEPKELGRNLFSFLVILLPISIIFSVYGILRSNMVLAILGIGILSTNLVSYYQMFYQATGDFKSYSIALNFSRVLVLLINMLLIFGVHTDYALAYILAAPMTGAAAAVYLTLKLNQQIPIFRHFRFSIKEVRASTHRGFVLMLGNFVANFFASIDRWFINYLMSTVSFAIYSFAVSMENVINTLMTPLSVTMFNYLRKSPAVEAVKRIKDCALIYGCIVIAAAFPAKWLLENFVPEYIDSTMVMFELFATQAISSIIRGVYVNKYKSDGREKRYFWQMVMMLLLSVILDAIFFMIWRSIEAIAMATVIVNVAWLVICEIDYSEYRYGIKEILCFGFMILIYLVVGHKLDPVHGCLIYCATGLLLCLTFMRKQFLFLIRSGRSLFRLNRQEDEDLR